MLPMSSHLLILRRSTPGASLDRLFVTNDPGFVPTDVPLVINPLPPITRASAL